MAKLINKSKCKFENGQIVKKNKVIGIPFAVWGQLNKLEIIVQQFAYLEKQPAYVKGPSLDGFERKSMLDTNRPYADAPDTPVTEERVAQAMQFMAECDAVNEAAKLNEIIDEYGELFDWLANDKFIAGDCFRPIDTPFLGNPLKIDAGELADLIGEIISSPIVLEG